jgi:hypothetical protein
MIGLHERGEESESGALDICVAAAIRHIDVIDCTPQARWCQAGARHVPGTSLALPWHPNVRMVPAKGRV